MWTSGLSCRTMDAWPSSVLQNSSLQAQQYIFITGCTMHSAARHGTLCAAWLRGQLAHAERGARLQQHGTGLWGGSWSRAGPSSPAASKAPYTAALPTSDSTHASTQQLLQLAQALCSSLGASGRSDAASCLQ